MVGGHTRNKASKKSREGFKQNFKPLTVPKKDNKTTIMKRGSRIRKASRKRLLSSERHQTPVATRKQDGEAISSVSIQTESVSETTEGCKNAESRKAQERIRLLEKQLMDKDEEMKIKLMEKDETMKSQLMEKDGIIADNNRTMKKHLIDKDEIIADKDRTIEQMTLLEKEQGKTPMNTIGTKGGRITNISELTGQTMFRFTTNEIAGFGPRAEKNKMKELVAAVEGVVNMYCRKEIFPENKFMSDEMATMTLHLGYKQKKIALGNVTVQQLLQVGPKLVHQGLAKWRKNAQTQAMQNFKGKEYNLKRRECNL